MQESEVEQGLQLGLSNVPTGGGDQQGSPRSGGSHSPRSRGLHSPRKERGEKSLQDMINESMKNSQHSAPKHLDFSHPLRRYALTAKQQVLINRGRFSWLSAIAMCIFVVGGFVSATMMFLSLQHSTFFLVSEETSYIDAPNPAWELPPWGYVKQPNDAPSRKMGKPFRYAMPQFMMFYSNFSACWGLFTVAYFCSELLVQDLGVDSVRNMGDLVNCGVGVYLARIYPIILMVILLLSGIIYFSAGTSFVISMIVGAFSCMGCANLGTNMNFEGGPRLAHAMNYDLSSAVQMGIRTGAIGGLSAHAMAQLGVVLVWMIVRDANALVGFGTGVSILSFYNRVGGGIFAKGSDIGSDFVSEILDEEQKEKMNEEGVEELLKLHFDDLEEQEEQLTEEQKREKEINKLIGKDGMTKEQEEAQARRAQEAQMAKAILTMHPVNYLDAIGENIADVGGTSSDLFETMCITLATSVILGSKIHKMPYFGTALPFAIISTGTIGNSFVAYKVWCHEKHSSNRIRRSLQLNLLIVVIFVELVVIGYCWLHWHVYRTITFDELVNYCLIILLGLISPELCASICEFFTAVNCPPVAWLAKDAFLGIIQVVLQGLGQGFVSAGVPSVVNIIVQIIAFRLEGFYGLTILSCASQACTGWQATLAAYGAVSNNALRMVHMTTMSEMAHHRANVCAAVGTTQAHNGKVVAGQNAFFATTALLGAMLADKRTKQGLNFQSTIGQELSEFARAGLLAGIIFTMLFLANTLTSCITMAKKLVHFCNDFPGETGPRHGKKFPATHIMPLKKLAGFAAIESFQLTFSPMFQTFAAPLVIGQLFGFKGLLMLVSGGNSVCFSLNMFLINSGQAWDAARKYVLFGMLKRDGETVGSESPEYETLGIGEQIGGPLEDLTGPALNNFIKFVAVVSFVTSDLYEEFPDNTWQQGLLQVFAQFAAISFFKFGLGETVRRVEAFFVSRQRAVEYEEGTVMLREIEAHERKLALKRSGEKEDAELQLV
eukprot:TRINITY_DN79034_c0_g1_i1.p1 TRINITY_DN79034_c0_g1~~TRINITY_DN79034_c0_g1_i1.p1  ORF type:complete len:1002 (+),score=189.30 TRINITY_DN79034_c0_g1_i1:144-3149(+)